jgi:hypothetical protein
VDLCLRVCLVSCGLVAATTMLVGCGQFRPELGSFIKKMFNSVQHGGGGLGALAPTLDPPLSEGAQNPRIST